MGARHPLPYAFAKAQHAAARGRRRALRAVGARDGRRCRRCREVLRLYDVDASSARRAATLAQRIAAAYAGGESSAAAVIGEVESAVDLSRMMQELPAIEDLLEAAERRADHPHAQRAADAGREGRRERHPHRALRALELGALSRRRHAARGGAAEPALHAALISRLKIMAELDIAEKRLPQDGRISLRIGGRAVDVRVSTLPSAHGERAVLRLLDKAESKFTLEGLGMSGDVLTHVRPPDRAAARHRARHRPDRLGQDDDAVRLARPRRHRTHQHPDGRGPGRVRAPRHRPDAGQPEDRPDLRQGAARDPAPGPRRHHDRRDPRLRDRADRDPGLAHRPPGARHACTPTTRRAP